jgi:hypothetical protein
MIRCWSSICLGAIDRPFRPLTGKRTGTGAHSTSAALIAQNARDEPHAPAIANYAIASLAACVTNHCAPTQSWALRNAPATIQCVQKLIFHLVLCALTHSS